MLRTGGEASATSLAVEASLCRSSAPARRRPSLCALARSRQERRRHARSLDRGRRARQRRPQDMAAGCRLLAHGPAATCSQPLATEKPPAVRTCGRIAARSEVPTLPSELDLEGRPRISIRFGGQGGFRSGHGARTCKAAHSRACSLILRRKSLFSSVLNMQVDARV